MSARATHSLQRKLFRRLLAVQSVVLGLVVAVLFGSGLLFDFHSTENTVEILRAAVTKDDRGQFFLKDTEALRRLRRDEADLWYVIRDGKGHQVSEGTIPPEYAGLGASLDSIGQARLGWNIGDKDKPIARMRWVETDVGRFQILTGSASAAPPYMVFLGISLIILKLVVPIFSIIAVGAFVATPVVVRRAMAGMGQAAHEADSIDIDKRGVRLSAAGMPSEVAPFVRAVNGALSRLDDGYERQERFLADAAHELRTPIAILKTRVASMPLGPLKSHLAEDAARLATLAEQMLDLQRLKLGNCHRSEVDLQQLAGRVVLDIGPLAFAAGYEVVFDGGVAAMMKVDAPAISRALTNLVQNAIDHGGRKGAITVAVGQNWISVGDEGPGISRDVQARIFEPFFKGRAGAHGAGLGLKLVQEIMQLHGGTVLIDEGTASTRFRLDFPATSEDAAVAGAE